MQGLSGIKNQKDGTYLTLTDKAPFLYSRGRGQVADGFELVRIAHGVDADAFSEAPRCYTVINSNSPRQLDIPIRGSSSITPIMWSSEPG